MLSRFLRPALRSSLVGLQVARSAATAAITNEDVERVSMAIERLDQLPPEVRGKDARFQPITQQLAEVVPKMTSAEIASTLTTLAIRGHRDVPVMRLMAQKLIEEDANLPPSQIVNVSVALKRLSFYFPPLYQFLATKFIYRVNEFSRWSQVASLVDAFAGMQIHNPQFWEVVCKWMDTHISSAPQNLNDVQRIISGCALVNLPPELLQRPVESVNERLIESMASKRLASEWLNLVHSLAVLRSLTPEAGRVFLPGFFEELRRTLHSAPLCRAVVHILQIASAFRHDLKQDVKLPGEILQFVKENEELVEKFRFRNDDRTRAEVESFRQTVYLIANVHTHAEPPQLDVETGAFVDAMFWTKPAEKLVLPLAEGPKTPGAERVAVIYGSPNLQTRKDATPSDSEGAPSTRPLGEIQMNLRHLKARGIRPVYVSCYALAALESTEHKLPHLREEIWKASGSN